MPNTVHNIFDLLQGDGRDTRALPLIWRKRLLRNLFQFSDPLRYLPQFSRYIYVTGNCIQLFQNIFQ